jgi:chemotaxis protein CheX
VLSEKYLLFFSKTNKDAKYKVYNDIFDVIIVEIQLVDGPVTEFILQLRELGLNKQTPLLILTTDIGDYMAKNEKTFENISKIFSASKPIDIKDLENKIEEIISINKPGPNIDVRIVNPIINSTVNTLEVMSGIKSTPGKFFIKKESEPSGDITGIIGISSSTYEGSIALSFSESLFLNVVERILGEKHESINAECKDAVAELINIIFGQAKVTLSQEGLLFQKSIPSIIVGKDHTVDHPSALPVIVVPFSSEVGSFRIEICSSEKEEKSKTINLK